MLTSFANISEPIPNLLGHPVYQERGGGGWLHLVMYRTHPLLSGKNRSLHVDEIEHADILAKSRRIITYFQNIFHTCWVKIQMHLSSPLVFTIIVYVALSKGMTNFTNPLKTGNEVRQITFTFTLIHYF